MTDDLFDDAFAQPPEPPADPPASRRIRRHRRTVRRRVIGGALAGLVVLAAILVATDTIRLGSGDRPVLASDNPTRPATRKPGAPAAFPVRALTATTPMRLWIAGDSLAYALGQSLGNMTATTGVVKPVYDARVSSGLTSPQFFDWPEHARKEETRLDPEAIVYIIGANDLGVVSGKDWEDNYGAKVDEMMDILAGPNNTRAVYWVGPPTFKNKTQNDASKKMNALMKERAAKHKSVTFIDGYDVFADDKGKYAAKLPNDNDELVLVRTDDGVHFTAAGGERLAKVVFAAMDRDWKIRAQAVPGAIQTIEQTAGCCSTPSGSNNTQWQVGTTPTRAPATTTKTTATTTAKTTATTTAAPSSTTVASTTPSTTASTTPSTTSS